MSNNHCEINKDYCKANKDYCKINTDLSDNLTLLKQKLDKVDNDREYARYHEIIANYDSIKTVLHSLNNCVETRIESFGNKRKIDSRGLIYAVNYYNVDMGFNLPILSYDNHVHHKDFLYVINTISSEVLGIEYMVVEPTELFSFRELLWKDETLIEHYYYGYDNFFWCLFCTPIVILLPFTIFLIPLVLLLNPLLEWKYWKFGFTLRKVK